MTNRLVFWLIACMLKTITLSQTLPVDKDDEIPVSSQAYIRYARTPWPQQALDNVIMEYL